MNRSDEPRGPRRPAVDTIRLSRLLKRLMLPLAIVLGFLLWFHYGTLTVPAGMDTMTAEFPPGSLCVIEKRPGPPQPGQVLLFVVADGVLLSRVSKVEGDHFWVAHDSRDSRFPDGDELGPLPFDAVRARVLTAFRADPGTAR